MLSAFVPVTSKMAAVSLAFSPFSSVQVFKISLKLTSASRLACSGAPIARCRYAPRPPELPLRRMVWRPGHGPVTDLSTPTRRFKARHRPGAFFVRAFFTAADRPPGLGEGIKDFAAEKLVMEQRQVGWVCAP